MTAEHDALMNAALDASEITGHARTHVLQSWQPCLAARSRPSSGSGTASWAGDAPLYDIDGHPLEHAALAPEALVHAIRMTERHGQY